MRKPWESWELDLIRHLPAGGLAAVARSLGRTLESVRCARHRYGLADPAPLWTADEREAFHAQVRSGASVQAAAVAVGRPAGSGYGRRHVDRRAGEDVPAAVRADGLGYRGCRGYLP